MGEISKKVQESRLKWYGHVSRREDEYVGKRVMGWRCRGKEGEEDQRSGGGWIASGTTSRRGGCQRRTRKTGLGGGVSQDTSTSKNRSLGDAYINIMGIRNSTID